MTPIVRDGYLCGFAASKPVCMQVATCRSVWSARPRWELPTDENGSRRGGQLARASMLWADGTFLCLGENGDLC